MSKPQRKPGGRPKYRKGKPAASSRPAAAVRPAGAPAPPQALAEVFSLAPLAPIIVRSGRPFDSQAGADPARMPPPSTIAGCVRTAWARQRGEPFGVALNRLAVAGPLLLRVSPAGDAPTLLVPKPADALYFGQGDAARLVRGLPMREPPDAGTDLPTGLALVALEQPEVEKPGPGPAWWALDDLWTFRRGESLTYAQVAANGWSPPPGERRTHVALDRGTLAAAAGQLFQTEGLDLMPDWSAAPAATAPLRLLVRCAEPLAAALVHLGGERRLAALLPEDAAHWPSAPPDLAAALGTAGGLTLTLLTPGLFAAGYRPGWLGADLIGSPPGCPGLRLQLIAAAVGRWQPQSGWDLARQAPRPARRLAPAGATYWFRLLDHDPACGPAALWLHSLCDDPQDRLDGFGLALPAPWSPAWSPA